MAFELAVLADDLTGALASASRLRSAGWSPLVRWREEDIPSAAEVVCIDMRTRDGREGSRAARVESWAAYMRERACSRYELRLDSTLRGHPADELEALTAGAGLQAPWILAVPAFPAAGRITRDGRQRLAPSAASAGELDVDVADRLFPGREVRNLTLAEVEGDRDAAIAAMREAAERGVRRFVADATEEAHLERIADWAAELEAADVQLVTASPGAWLGFRRPPRADRFVLVVIATAAPTTRIQLEQLEASGEKVSRLDPAAASASKVDFAPGATVVVETVAAPDPHAGLAGKAAAAAAQLLGRAEAAGRTCQGIVVSGGHAAACLVDELGAYALTIEREPLPLCSRGALVGGPYDGLPLIAKGGLVGERDALLDLARDLWGEL